MESVPGLRPEDQTIAVLVSDLHLSHQKPSIRTDDWYEVQAGYLKQLADFQTTWDVPIICAGDVLDRWSQPPEFINWAIDHLPEMWTVFGQHDLPNHQESEIHRSAFWTLKEFGKLKLLNEFAQSFYLSPFQIHGYLHVYGYGWGKPILPPLEKQEGIVSIDLAVCHRYVWSNPGNSFPDAPESGRVEKINKEFRTYDAVLFGDNHRTVSWIDNQHQHRLNPGTFLRRKSDEIDHKPCVGLLKADGSIEKKYLDVSGDKFADRPAGEERNLDGLVEELNKLGDSGLDFESAVLRAMEREKIPERVRKTILEAMET